MYWRIAVTLVAAWLLALVIMGTRHPLIHLLLALAAIVFVVHIRVGDRNPI